MAKKKNKAVKAKNSINDDPPPIWGPGGDDDPPPIWGPGDDDLPPVWKKTLSKHVSSIEALLAKHQAELASALEKHREEIKNMNSSNK